MTNPVPARPAPALRGGPLAIALAAPFVALVVLHVVASPRAAACLAIVVMAGGFAVLVPPMGGVGRRILTGICLALLLIAGVVAVAP